VISSEPRLGERIEVASLNTVAQRLYQVEFGVATFATELEIRALLAESSQAAGDHELTARFLLTEWRDVVDAWQLASWEAYRVKRLGRKTRLPEQQRAVQWSIFERLRSALAAKSLIGGTDAQQGR